MVEGNKKLFSGYVAFTLYDTYGFPLDLTQDILRGYNIEVNLEEFEKAMQEQKERSKWTGTGDTKNNELYYQIKEKIQETEFLGYDKNVVTGKILAIIKDGSNVSEAKSGDEVEFFTDKTSFYGEMGGQCGDTGIAMQINEDGRIQLPFSIVEITDVKQPFDKYYLHKGIVENGQIKVGDFLNLAVNVERRNKIKANHSAVHLLEAALRNIYGDTVVQKGSSVNEFGARYDFALNKQVDDGNLRQIEDIVNKAIYKKTPTATKIMPIEEAKKMNAIALFGEKYGDMVRVVFIGEIDKKETMDNLTNSPEDIFTAMNILNNSSARNYFSIDFCGGTHIENTGDIGFFKIVGESSIGNGIRRIEILTGLDAIRYVFNQVDVVRKTADFLEIGVDEVFDKVNKLNEELKSVRKELNNLKKNNLSNVLFDEEKINDITFASVKLSISPADFKGVFIDKQNKKYNDKSVVVAITEFDDKKTIMVGVSKDINNRFKANEIIKRVGQGGGQEWFAMGSFLDNDVLLKIKEILVNV
ncbi:MAG: hypothetical protein LBC92_02180 [Rickettsiales bacterium]|jgi:alanyl-tRNA synthetase|nr:hypothetical protein [Rickettsiales bacterium]